MISTSRYYPKGYIGPEQAAVLLARLRSPENWRPDAMFPDEEAEIWTSLGVSLNAEFIWPSVRQFREGLTQTDPAALFERFRDFDYAVQDIREALHAGEIVAEFCDERGTFQSIAKDGWGTEGGLVALLRGVAQMDNGFVRLILLKRDQIKAFALSGPEVMVQAALTPSGPEPNDSHYPLPTEPPRGPQQQAAFRIARRIYSGGGPSRSQSWREITDHMDKHRTDGEKPLAEDTVKRMFLGK